jgi:hypothetical protein
MQRVLKRLGYVDPQGIITIKGKVRRQYLITGL